MAEHGRARGQAALARALLVCILCRLVGTGRRSMKVQRPRVVQLQTTGPRGPPVRSPLAGAVSYSELLGGSSCTAVHMLGRHFEEALLDASKLTSSSVVDPECL